MPRSKIIVTRRSQTRNFISTGEYIDPGFNFGSISGLKLDFHPLKQKMGSGSLQDGDPIPYMKDSKGGQIFSQGTMTKRPLWNKSDSDFNGRPSITFDGYDDFLLLSSAYLTGTVGSMFAVIKNEANTNASFMLSSARQTSSNRYLFLSAQNANRAVHIEGNNNNDLRSVRAGFIQPSNRYIICIYQDGTSWKVKINNVNQGITVGYGNSNWWFGTISLRTNTGFGVMKDTAGETAYFQGKIARLLVYDNVNLSAGNMTTIHNELSSLYGISI